MRLAVVSSPTGGHLIPAALVVQEAIECEHDVRFYSGNIDEPPWLPKTDVAIQSCPVQPWMGQGIDGRIRSLVSIARSWWQRRTDLRGVDAVISFGGFVSLPFLIAAQELGIPIFQHEQNRHAGRAIRLFAPFSTLTFLGFPTITQLAGKTELVGTPVRDGEETIDEWFRQDPLLVVVGGSQGARGLSTRAQESAPALLDSGWKIFHLYGTHGLPLDSLAENYPNRFRSQPAHPHLPAILRQATVAWTRAGAGTLTELVQFDTPAVLFPYPHAADDHQRANGHYLADHGPAVLGDALSVPDGLVDVTRELSRETTTSYEDLINPARAPERILDRVGHYAA